MGNTCAHIAAEKGSAEVVKELLKFNKPAVTSARNKTSDATPLHLAAKGGHVDLVKILLENGASVTDENRVTYTMLCPHLIISCCITESTVVEYKALIHGILNASAMIPCMTFKVYKY
jgi:hypothetical protein